MVQIDIDMPKSCANCPCGNAQDGWCYVHNEVLERLENGYPDTTKRPDWCPIKESVYPTTSDLIERRAALDAVVAELYGSNFQTCAIEALEELPSIKSKHGKWIPCTKEGMPLTEYGRMKGEKWYGYKCSKCNFIYKGNALIECNFCQKCGADMRMDG